MHRARSAASGRARFLEERCADDVAERLEAVNRTFPRVLVFGGANAFLAAVEARPELRAKIGWMLPADWSERLVPGGLVFAPDHVPLAQGSFDLIVSFLALHWSEDLPGALIQLRRALKPDGLFIGTLFGGQTLEELRSSLLDAEAETVNGAGLRVAPMTEVRTLGTLLQRAGFALPVVDCDVVNVRYRDLAGLFRDLRAMGETSPLAEKQPALRRSTLKRLLALYQTRHAEPDGRLRATYEILTASGWSPHDSQQKPLKPGSAQRSLAEAVKGKPPD